MIVLLMVLDDIEGADTSFPAPAQDTRAETSRTKTSTRFLSVVACWCTVHISRVVDVLITRKGNKVTFARAHK